MVVTVVLGVTVRPLPTLDWLKVPAYGPPELTATLPTSVVSTPDKVCVAAVMVAAVVPSYALLAAVKPVLMVSGAGVMLAVSVCGPTPVT